MNIERKKTANIVFNLIYLAVTTLQKQGSRHPQHRLSHHSLDSIRWRTGLKREAIWAFSSFAFICVHHCFLFPGPVDPSEPFSAASLPRRFKYLEKDTHRPLRSRTQRITEERKKRRTTDQHRFTRISENPYPPLLSAFLLCPICVNLLNLRPSAFCFLFPGLTLPGISTQISQLEEDDPD